MNRGESQVSSDQWIKADMKKTMISLSFMLFALCSFAEAQQPKKVPRIGYLHAASASSVAARTEAFREGLRELGYVEGKNILIEYRYAEGKFDPAGPCGGACTSQGGCHRHDCCVANSCCQGSNCYDSDCHDAGSRSRWNRFRR